MQESKALQTDFTEKWPANGQYSGRKFKYTYHHIQKFSLTNSIASLHYLQSVFVRVISAAASVFFSLANDNVKTPV